MQTNKLKHSLRVGIVGTGIAGMSAAWLLSKKHDVTVFEMENRVGGHSNTVDIDGLGIDTGFIVYNAKNYPNLTALFDYLGVASQPTQMSFGVSVDQGKFEYSGGSIPGLFARKSNLFRPRFWRMTRDILRFYNDAKLILTNDVNNDLTVGQYLHEQGYSKSFTHDHLLPMGAAIWSTPIDKMLEYPLMAFLEFCDNHGLLQFRGRPEWRTVIGGSREYIKHLVKDYYKKIKIDRAVKQVWSDTSGAYIMDYKDNIFNFDQVVMATHADQTLKILKTPSSVELNVLGSFSYQTNEAILHTDPTLMPNSKKAWSSWNYLNTHTKGQNNVCVTYWMNKLQDLKTKTNYFVTLNPTKQIKQDKILRRFTYQHPVFNNKTRIAQRNLWNLQGKKLFWFCGSYFGHGFHEDGLQSGLAVAEELGGFSRPWSVKNQNGRIYLPENWPNYETKEAG